MTEQTNAFQDLIPPQQSEPLVWLDLLPGTLLILAVVIGGSLALRCRRQIAGGVRALLQSWIVYPVAGLVVFGFAVELGHLDGARDGMARAVVFMVCMAVVAIPMATKLFRRS